MDQTRSRIRLASGRKIILESLVQRRVYAGLLEGLPTRESNNRKIQAEIADARQQDGREPFHIMPERRTIDYEGRYPFGEPEALPSICCIARFRSSDTARDSEMYASSLTIIWYQDDYAFPISEYAAQVIHQLDWEKYASDEDY